MSRKDLEAKPIKIEKVIFKIEDGDIKIPAFQRGYVWDESQVIDLLDSIYKDYPIGSILLWLADKDVRLRSTRNIAGIALPTRKDEYPVNYVLDGQQRLSSLYAIFKHGHEGVEYETEGIGIPDHDTFDVYFDIENQKFLHSSELPKYIKHKKNQLSVFDVHKKEAFIKFSHILDHESLISSIVDLEVSQRKIVIDLQKKFNNYEIPIVTISGRTKTEVGVIFERINNTGTPLTTLDLMIAWTWGDNFNLREEINNIVEELGDKGFGNLPDKLILQCISSLVSEKVSTEEILKLETAVVRSKMGKVRKSLQQAIDFLSTHLGIVSTDFLPNNLQIIPIAYFFSKSSVPNSQHIRLLTSWFWKNSFADRYRYDTARRIYEDIQFIKEILSGKVKSTRSIKSAVNKDSFIKQPFSKISAFTKAYLLMLASNKPLNLISGEKIDVGKSLSNYNHKEYHHIFPKAFLKKKGKDKSKINCLANYCFLPSLANKKISDSAPSNYILSKNKTTLFNTEDTSSIFLNKEIMESNFLPIEESIYFEDDFEKFINERSKLLYKYYQELVK